MSIYEKNITALRKNNKGLYDAVKEYHFEKDEREFYVETARNGMPVFCTKHNDRTIYMNSRYDPEREAERYVKQFEKVFDYSVMIFFGFGNGMVAKRLVREKGEHVEFIFYEPSPHLFLSALERIDLTDLLENPRVTIVVGKLNDDQIDTAIALRITSENYRISLYNVLPVYEQLYEEEIKKIKSRYSYIVKLICQNIGTSFSFGNLLAYNAILNMKSIPYCNCEEQFGSVFPLDRPAIVVAAGPSLEKNVEYLKNAKGKMLILAVDSVLPYLSTRGIIPDLAFTIDARIPVELFENRENRMVPLAIIPESNHEAVERTEGKIVFVSARYEYYSKLFQLAGKKLYNIVSGGNVATMAFSVAVALGYRKIVLVGQDLALAEDKVHAGNVDAVLGTGEMEDDRIEVDGYNGQKVFTIDIYNRYRQWYEYVIRNDDNLEVINATEGGAKIEGATQMPLRQVIERYDVESFDFEKTIREMPPVFDEEHREELVQMWKKSIENLDVLKRKLYDGIRLLKKGMDLIHTKRYKRSEIERIQKRVKKINEECDELAEIHFLSDIVAGEQADVLGDIYIEEKDNEEETWRLFEKMMQYMKAMHGSVDEVKELFEKIIAEDAQEKDDGGII